MKKLIVVVVVLAAVLLVAPYGIGKVAESRLNRGLDKIVEQAPYLVIAERKWTGGWFKSRQEVTFELGGPFAAAMNPEVLAKAIADEAAENQAAMDAEGTAMPDDEGQTETTAEGETAEGQAEEGAAAEAAPADPAKPARFKVFNDVLHGPVLGTSGFGLARVDTTVDLPPEVVAKIREAFGPKPALEIRTRVGFFGGGTTTFTSEGRTIKPDKEEDTQVSYETFKLAVGFGRNADKYDIDGKWPKFEVKGKGGTFTMNTMTMDGDGERVKGDLYDGDFAFRIEEIKFSDPATNKTFSMDDAHYVVDTRTKDGFVAMSAQFGTGAVKSPDIASVGLEIQEIHYNFSLRHLHADSMEKILKGMREAYTVAPITQGPEAVEAAVFEPMKANAAELLKHDPEFAIDRVGLVTPEGEGVIKGVIKFVGVTPEDFAAPGGMALVGKLDADITVEVAVKLAEKLPNGATTAGLAVDSGYAKREGDKYVCHILFKQGELTVNGKPQAIPGLGGPPPGPPAGE